MQPGRTEQCERTTCLQAATYDSEEEFIAYCSNECFRESLLISQSRPHVIHYVRQSRGKWLRDDIEGMEKEVALESIEVVLPLSEIYERIKFQPERPSSTLRRRDECRKARFGLLFLFVSCSPPPGPHKIGRAGAARRAMAR
jgi:hypothetical protein